MDTTEKPNSNSFLICDESHVTRCACDESRVSRCACDDPCVTRCACDESRVSRCACDDPRVSRCACDDSRVIMYWLFQDDFISPVRRSIPKTSSTQFI